MIAQLKDALRLDGRLKGYDTLSVQALIDVILVSKLLLKKGRGSIKSLESARYMLRDKRTVFERSCPLDYEIGKGDRILFDQVCLNFFFIMQLPDWQGLYLTVSAHCPL